MYITYSLRSLLAVLLLLPIGNYAASIKKPLAELKTYPDTTVIISSTTYQTNHPIIINPMKRVHGRVSSDDAKWLNGTLERTLYQFPEHYDTTDILKFFVSQFEQIGIQKKFSCASYACGASNFWANDIYKLPTLYGVDKSQNYFIGQKQDAYYSTYVVRRGNGRLYALIEIFYSDTEIKKYSQNTPATNYFKKDIELFLNSDFLKNTQLIELEKTLQKNPETKILFIVSIDKPLTFNQLKSKQEKAQQFGEKLINYLLLKGINKKQLKVSISTTIETKYSSLYKVNVIFMDD